MLSSPTMPLTRIGLGSRSDDLISLVSKYSTTTLVLLFVWCIGWLQLSVSWVMLALFVLGWRERTRTRRRLKEELAKHAALNEQGAILARLDEVPAWVYFPDVERCEWMNKLMAHIWPFLHEYIISIIREVIEPNIQKQMPAAFSSIKFEKIDLGDKSPRVDGIKVYTDRVKRDEVILDMSVSYTGDSRIKLNIKGFNAGVKNIQLHGVLRVILKPFIRTMPFFGGITYFFLTTPDIDFDLTDVANALDLPGFNDILHSIIRDFIASAYVLPNRQVIPMVNDINLGGLKYPMPEGVVQIHAIEARDLIKADISLFGQGKSDPYVVIKAGSSNFKTKVIENNLNPRWNEVFEAVIEENKGQAIDIDLFDKDPGNEDDELGRTSVEMASLKEKGEDDSWLPLDGVKSGAVHMRFVWFHLSSDPALLLKAEKYSLTSHLSSAVLAVYLDSGNELGRVKQHYGYDPSPYVILSLANRKEESTVQQGTSAPRWEQSFYFLVVNAEHQVLELTVKDKKNGKTIGSAAFQLSQLITSADMTRDQPIRLLGSKPDARLNMRFSLHALTTQRAVPAEGEEGCTDERPKPLDLNENKVPAPASPAPTTMTSSTSTSSSLSTMEAQNEKSSDLRRRVVAPAADTGAPQPRINLTVRYSAQRGKLTVVVHRCEHLSVGDVSYLPDPYVKVTLLPDRLGGKKKTDSIKDNLNPVYDATLEFTGNLTDIKQRILHIEVKNSKPLFSKERIMIGEAQLELDPLNLPSPSTHWLTLTYNGEVKK